MFAKKKIFIYSIILTATFLVVIFCVLILLRNKNFENEYSFNIGFAPKNFYEDNCGCSLEKILSYRTFKTYELTNEENKNQILFNQIRLAVRNIVQNNDSENGIHVKFNVKTTYGNVIKILDICEIEKAPTYVLEGYEIWIMAGSNSESQKNCPFKNKRE